MRLYHEKEIEFMDGRKINDCIVGFMTGDRSGFIAVMSAEELAGDTSTDSPVDIYSTRTVKAIHGAILARRK